MKHSHILYLIPFLFLVHSFQSFGQMTTVWQKKIDSTYTVFRQSKTAPDGKVYSVGQFGGRKKAVFGNIEVWPDTAFIPDCMGSENYGETTGFIACQDANGDFVWVRTLTTSCGLEGINLSHVCIDGTGNVVVAGNSFASIKYFIPGSFGGLAYFNSVPFYAPSNDPLQHHYGHFEFVLKISPQGNLLWNKVFQSTFSQNLHLDVVDNKIELLFQHDSLMLEGAYYSAGYSLLKLTTDGAFLSVNNQNFNNLVHQDAYRSRIFIRRLPDLTWAVAFFGWLQLPLGTVLVELSPDFSSILDTVRFRTISATDSSTFGGPVLILGDIVNLPEGKRGYVFQFDTQNYGDEKLIWKNDTLDLGIPPLDSTISMGNSFFLKTEGTSCVKQASVMPFGPYYGLGANQTGTGNFFTISGFSQSAFLKQFDRNGNFISSLDLGQPNFETMFTPQYEFGNQWILFGDYAIDKVGNHLYISNGPYLTKVLINEVATTDVSFAGCLSNRTLLTTVQEQESQDAYVFNQDHNLVYRQSSEQEGTYRLVNPLGQTISGGKLTGAETRIPSNGQPKGIYLLTIQQKNKLTTHRVMW